MSQEVSISWRRQPRQWAALGFTAALLALAVLLFAQWRAAKGLENDRRQRAAQLAADANRRQILAGNLTEYEELLQQYGEQKEQLIREIGEFQKQLDLLKARTDRLDRAHHELQRLEDALSALRPVQERFEVNLRALENTGQKGANR